jgi:hypothetical protein
VRTDDEVDLAYYAGPQPVDLHGLAGPVKVEVTDDAAAWR